LVFFFYLFSIVKSGGRKERKKTETELRSLCINCGPEKSPCGQSFGHFASLYNKPKNKKKTGREKKTVQGQGKEKKNMLCMAIFHFEASDFV